jgi:hypothetical protein
MDTRLRVGRSIEKTEDEVAMELMAQLKARGHPDDPPGVATDGNDSYHVAMVKTWGDVPEYSGRGRPPTAKQARPQWNLIQIVKHRSGGRLKGITHKVVYGDPEKVCNLMGKHTAYVERTHLTSRQMNGRLVRKTLSFSKELEMLRDSCAWEDWVYNMTRPVKTLRIEVNDGQRRWEQRSPAMVAGLTDHIWSVEELLMNVVAPVCANTPIRKR